MHGAVDVLTGAPLAVRAYAADENEYQHYPALLEQVKDATGKLPDRVAGDRGLSRPEVFRHNTAIREVTLMRAEGLEPPRLVATRT